MKADEFKQTLTEEKVRSIVRKILETNKMEKTNSGYYLTTPKIESDALKQKGIEYMRVYRHVKSDSLFLYIKFTDNSSIKCELSIEDI